MNKSVRRHPSFFFGSNVGHFQGEVILNGIHRTLQAACTAVPAFDRIENDGFLILLWPGEDVARADVVTISALGTLIVDNRWHKGAP
jgi:hypothetical protein